VVCILSHVNSYALVRLKAVDRFSKSNAFEVFGVALDLGMFGDLDTSNSDLKEEFFGFLEAERILRG